MPEKTESAAQNSAGGVAPAPAPASVTPAELHEALRRAGLSGLNAGQQADFLKGLQAIAALAARLPREVPLALPFGFDFRPDLHAPPPNRRAKAPGTKAPARPAGGPRTRR